MGFDDLRLLERNFLDAVSVFGLGLGVGGVSTFDLSSAVSLDVVAFTASLSESFSSSESSDDLVLMDDPWSLLSTALRLFDCRDFELFLLTLTSSTNNSLGLDFLALDFLLSSGNSFIPVKSSIILQIIRMICLIDSGKEESRIDFMTFCTVLEDAPPRIVSADCNEFRLFFG